MFAPSTKSVQQLAQALEADTAAVQAQTVAEQELTQALQSLPHAATQVLKALASWFGSVVQRQLQQEAALTAQLAAVAAQLEKLTAELAAGQQEADDELVLDFGPVRESNP